MTMIPPQVIITFLSTIFLFLWGLTIKTCWKGWNEKKGKPSVKNFKATKTKSKEQMRIKFPSQFEGISAEEKVELALGKVKGTTKEMRERFWSQQEGDIPVIIDSKLYINKFIDDKSLIYLVSWYT